MHLDAFIENSNQFCILLLGKFLEEHNCVGFRPGRQQLAPTPEANKIVNLASTFAREKPETDI